MQEGPEVTTPSVPAPTPSARELATESQSTLKGLVKTVRPHQWVKNVFVLAPMVFHKDLFIGTPWGTALNLAVTFRALAATVVFCLLAGAVYTINDLVDVEADRIHPVKRYRPIASGVVPGGAREGDGGGPGRRCRWRGPTRCRRGCCWWRASTSSRTWPTASS